MLPAPRGLRAHFGPGAQPAQGDPPTEGAQADDEDEDDGESFCEVLAFDEDGNALVIDEKEGKLKPANSYSNFLGLYQLDDERTFVGAIPSGGWQVQDGDRPVEPLVGWALTVEGDAQPIRAYGCLGWASEDEDIKLIPPTPTWAAPPTAGRANGRINGEHAQSAHTPTGRINGTPKAPNGRVAHQPNDQPIDQPNGVGGDGLTDLQRERLAQLAQEFPGDMPGRDKVMAHMRAQGYDGWTSKGPAEQLMKTLRAQRKQQLAGSTA